MVLDRSYLQAVDLVEARKRYRWAVQVAGSTTLGNLGAGLELQASPAGCASPPRPQPLRPARPHPLHLCCSPALPACRGVTDTAGEENERDSPPGSQALEPAASGPLLRVPSQPLMGSTRSVGSHPSTSAPRLPLHLPYACLAQPAPQQAPQPQLQQLLQGSVGMQVDALGSYGPPSGAPSSQGGLPSLPSSLLAAAVALNPFGQVPPPLPALLPQHAPPPLHITDLAYQVAAAGKQPAAPAPQRGAAWAQPVPEPQLAGASSFAWSSPGLVPLMAAAASSPAMLQGGGFDGPLLQLEYRQPALPALQPGGRLLRQEGQQPAAPGGAGLHGAAGASPTCHGCSPAVSLNTSMSHSGTSGGASQQQGAAPYPSPFGPLPRAPPSQPSGGGDSHDSNQLQDASMHSGSAGPTMAPPVLPGMPPVTACSAMPPGAGSDATMLSSCGGPAAELQRLVASLGWNGGDSGQSGHDAVAQPGGSGVHTGAPGEAAAARCWPCAGCALGARCINLTTAAALPLAGTDGMASPTTNNLQGLLPDFL